MGGKKGWKKQQGNGSFLLPSDFAPGEARIHRRAAFNSSLTLLSERGEMRKKKIKRWEKKKKEREKRIRQGTTVRILFDASESLTLTLFFYVCNSHRPEIAVLTEVPQ